MGNQIMTYEELLIENERLKNQLSKREVNENALNQKVNSLIESQRLVHVGYWEYDLNTHKITWSDEVYNIFGLDKTTYTPSLTGLADLIHPDDLWVIDPETIERNTKAGIQEMEYRIIDQSTKQIKYVVGKGITLRDSEGQDIKNFGTFQDITKRKLAELELLKTKEKAKENESYLEALIQSIDSIVVARNRRNEVVYFNEEFNKITQKVFGIEAHRGLVTLDYLEKEQKQYWLAQLQEVLQGNVLRDEFSWDFPGKEKRYYEISHYPVYKNNEIVGTLEINHDVTDRKLAEEKIRFQASLIEQVQNAIVTVDFNNKIQSWNKHAECLYQWKEEEVLGRDIIELLGTEEHKAETLNNFESLANNGYWEGNYNVKRKDGTTLSAHIINSYLKDKDGENVGFIGYSTDISHQLQVEKEVEESLLTFAQAEKLAKIGSWKLDISTMKVSWSEGVFDIFKTDKFKEKKLWEKVINRIHPDDKQYVMDVTNKAIEDSKPYELEYRIVLPNGIESIVLVNGNPVFDDRDKLVSYVGVVKDISDRRKSESELRIARSKSEENEKRLKLATHSAQLGIWDWNVKDDILNWDGRMYELYGQDKNSDFNTVELWSKGLHPDDRERAMQEAKDALEGIRSFDTTFRVLHPDGKVVYIKGDGLILRDEEGRAVRMIGINRDITESKIREKELIKAKEEAEENEKRLTLAAKAAQLGIWDWDIPNNLLNWDERTYELYGQERGAVEANFELWSERVHPKDIERAIKELNDALDGIKEFDSIFRIIQPKGKVLYIKADGLIIRDKEGNPLRMIGVNRDITESRNREVELIKAKEKAEESEQRLTLATNSAQLGIWDWNINDNTVTWDERTYELFGQDKENVEGSAELWSEVVHQDDLEKVQEAINNALAGNKEYDTTFRVVHPNGEVVHINGYGLVLKDAEGNATRMIGINRDVTEATIREIELKKSKEKAERIAQELKESQKVAQLGSWYLNLFTNEVTWSDELFNIYGYEPGSTVPDYPEFEQLTSPDSWKILTQKIEMAIETGRPYELELEFFRKDRSKGWMWARGEAVFDSNQKIIGIRGASQDITERKQLELALTKAKDNAEESESLLKKIAENFPNAYVSLIERDFTLSFSSGQEYVNQEIKPEDFIGNKVETMFGEHTKLAMAMYQKTFKGEETRFELCFNDMYLFFKTVPLYNEDGNITRILVVSENITEQKKKEIELHQAKEKAEESDRLKSEFINNMSHEIRTPMNGILGFSDMLSDKDISAEKKRHFISIIQNSGNQLMRIIDDILEISKLGTKQVKVLEKEICLNDLLLEHFSVFDIKAKENKTPLYLRKGLSDKESYLFTDESKLNKILSNLLENAIKYTHEGFIEFGYQVKNQLIELYVKDTGIGIKEGMHKKIFDRFSQEEKELSKNVGGLGLGLSIAKENAELLQGTITLESEKGKGSTFYITIPHKKSISSIMKDQPNNSEENTNENRRTVLVAEDEEINFFYIEVLLGKEPDFDINVLHAKNGEEAVEICQGNADISLVLMDLKMPVMSGFEATEKIKEMRPNLPIVAQTAYTRAEEKEKAFAAGCSDFISKPLNKRVLSEVLIKYLT